MTRPAQALRPAIGSEPASTSLKPFDLRGVVAAGIATYSANVPQRIPQACNHVKVSRFPISTYSGAIPHLFRAHVPHLGALSRGGHFFAGLDQHNIWNSRLRSNPQSPRTIACTDIEERFSIIRDPRGDTFLHTPEVMFPAFAKVSKVRRQTAVSRNGILEVMGGIQSIILDKSFNSVSNATEALR